MVGIPASGKSSLARLVAHHAASLGAAAWIVDLDAIESHLAAAAASSSSSSPSCSSSSSPSLLPPPPSCGACASPPSGGSSCGSSSPGLRPFDVGAWRASRRAAEEAASRLVETRTAEGLGVPVVVASDRRIGPGEGRTGLPVAPPPDVVVVDDNMYYTGMRAPYYSVARSCNCGYAQLYAACGVECAVERNSQRTHGRVPEFVIRNMATKLQAPDPNLPNKENKWDSHTVVFHSDSHPLSEWSDLWGSLLSLWAIPLPPKITIDEASQAASRQTNLQSVAHQFDLQARDMIGGVMKSSPPDKRHILAKPLADLKAQFIQRIHQTPSAMFSVSELSLEFEMGIKHLLTLCY
ncbi:O-phosphoseryl-tRNA(Sec) kinase [Pelomyxa schiedti]|nr:O-phosphoseryl-tRNA(Sec) kinase [Pelomyxa schiedti]